MNIWRVRHAGTTVAAVASLAAIMLTLTGCQPKELSATYTIINNTNQELYITGLGIGYVASIPAHSQGIAKPGSLRFDTCTVPHAIDTTWTYLVDGPKICDGDTWTITTPPTEPAPYVYTHDTGSEDRPKVCNITTGCPTPTSTRPPSTAG